MYRNGVPVQHAQYEKINIVLNNAAVGDSICSLPAIIHARKCIKNEILVWAPEYLLDLLSLLLFPYGDFTYRRLEDFPRKASERNVAEDGPVVINGIQSNQFTRNRCSLVDYAFAPISDSWPDNDAERSYPTEAPIGRRTIPGPYIVIPVNATSDNKLFHHTVLGPVVEWVLGAGFKPVITGKSTTKLHAIGFEGKPIELKIRTDYDKLPDDLRAECLDLRDKLTLVQVRDVCGHAAHVVGVDGGTIHVAATTDAPIVYCLTTTRPEHRSVVRHGKSNWRVKHVTPRDLECAGCQSNWRMVIRHDFSTCFYGDSLCVERLSPQDIIDAISQLTTERL